jgi:hypothetical protein
MQTVSSISKYRFNQIYFLWYIATIFKHVNGSQRVRLCAYFDGFLKLLQGRIKFDSYYHSTCLHASNNNLQFNPNPGGWWTKIAILFWKLPWAKYFFLQKCLAKYLKKLFCCRGFQWKCRFQCSFDDKLSEILSFFFNNSSWMQKKHSSYHRLWPENKN